jgi:hypothetical protein
MVQSEGMFWMSLWFMKKIVFVPEARGFVIALGQGTNFLTEGSYPGPSKNWIVDEFLILTD